MSDKIDELKDTIAAAREDAETLAKEKKDFKEELAIVSSTAKQLRAVPGVSQGDREYGTAALRWLADFLKEHDARGGRRRRTRRVHRRKRSTRRR